MVCWHSGKRFGGFTRMVSEFVKPGLFKKQRTHSISVRYTQNKIPMSSGWGTGGTKSGRVNLRSSSSNLPPVCATAQSLRTGYAIPNKFVRNFLKRESNIVGIYAISRLQRLMQRVRLVCM